MNSGEEGSPITYSAYPGEVVTLDGTTVEVPEWGGLFDMSGRSYITVQGFRVIHVGPNPHNPGILADTSHHITVRDCFTSHTNDSGIGVWGSHDVVVEGCEVTQACLANFNEAISVGGSYDFVVRGCDVHGIAKEGICLKDGSYRGKAYGNHVHHNTKVNIYVDAWDKHTHDIDVYGNTLHDSAHNGISIASEQGGLLENIRVYNNLSYDNTFCGIYLTTCCIDSHPVSNIQIVNNTIVNNGREAWGGGIMLENPQAQGVVIRNNICSQNLTFQIAVSSLAGYVADHNLIDGFRGDPEEIRGTDFVEGDPLFVNGPGHDYHLKGNSPATGAGASEYCPADDFDGYLRGNPPTIGAFEHHVCVLTCAASASPPSGTAPLAVFFSSSASTTDCTSTPSFAWSFGDGGTSSSQNAAHTYAAAGTYAWTLAVTADGKVCSQGGTVTVEEPCSLDCSASASPPSGPAPLAVAFVGQAFPTHCAGEPTYAWAFGDGETASVQNPSHTYPATGNYAWTLTVSLDGEVCSRGGTVTVEEPCSLDCSASASPPSGPAPLAVAFVGQAFPTHCAGEPTYAWAFGDGESSTQQNPSHTYTEPGVYAWAFSVTAGGATCARDGSITVTHPCSLLCATVVPSSGRSKTPLAFSASAVTQNCAGEPHFDWWFGDGQTDEGAEVNHTYASAGAYSWRVMVFVEGKTCEREGTLVVEPKIPGDADDDGTVSIGEVQQAVNMFLGLKPVGSGVDCDGDGTVSIGEVQKVINAFLGVSDSC
jgi:PKD repeat protein